jgi:hypothetical protein
MKILPKILLVLFCSVCIVFNAMPDESARDQVISSAHYANGDAVPYLLTVADHAKPKYVLILMPGGAGRLEPQMRDGKIAFMAKGNFLIRSRNLFADHETAVISTDASGSPERIGAITEDARRRFADVKFYVLGTSRSTLDTIQLAERMDGKVAGFVHTSSFNAIASLDTRALKSRQLIVHHQKDGCNYTLYGAAQRNHEKFGTELISMEGGISQGDPCEAFAYHGYNGIERETVDKIKAWIKQL